MTFLLRPSLFSHSLRSLSMETSFCGLWDQSPGRCLSQGIDHLSFSPILLMRTVTKLHSGIAATILEGVTSSVILVGNLYFDCASNTNLKGTASLRLLHDTFA